MDSAEDLELYATASDSRQLPTTPLALGTVENSPEFAANSTTNLDLLLYETGSGSVAALLRLCDVDSNGVHIIHYHDITNRTSQSLPQGYRNMSESTLYDNSSEIYSIPFTTASVSAGGSNMYAAALCHMPVKPSMINSKTPSAGNFIRAEFVNKRGFIPGVSGGMVAFDKDLHNSSILTNMAATGQFGPQIRDDSSISRSDLAVFGSWASCALWIDNTSAVVSSTKPLQRYKCVEPAAAFPYARLASVTLLDQTETFLYHQMNGTTLAEEHFTTELNMWLPTQYITIGND